SNTQVDYTPDDREYFAPAFTWRPDGDTSVTLLASYLRSEGGGAEQSFPASGTIESNPNGDIAHDLFLGEPDHNKSEIHNGSISLIADHRFNEFFAVHSTTRYLYAEADYDTVGARSGTLVSDRFLQRNAQIRQQTSHQVLTDNSLETNFDTGPVYHTLLTGVDYATYERDETRFSGTVADLDVFDPVYGQPIAFSSTPIVDTTIAIEQFGLYAQEQAQFEGLTLTGNLRFDWVESNTKNHLTGTRTVVKDEALTWRLGAIYAFDFGLSPYVSYSTSFFPQVAAPAFDGSSFDPTEGELYEIGVKYQPPGSNSFITTSLFHITQTNVLSPDPSHVGYFLETGEVVSQGVEVEGRLDLMDGLYALASYSYTDAKVTEDTFLTGVEGNQMVGVPKHMGSVWLDYTFQDGPLEGLGLGAGARYVGESFDASNSNRVDDYTLVDAAIRYDLGELMPALTGAQLKLEVTNLFDTEYYTPGFSRNLVFAGYERRVLGTLTYRW
ncbi:MAG: TonB-dependent siderophore receptor, partial [Kiloniellaceae bacterium]